MSTDPMAGSTDAYSVRRATQSDLPALGPIDTSSAELFRTVDLAAVADDPPISTALLQKYLGSASLWVADVAASACPVGFLAATYLANHQAELFLHVAQISVDAAYQRRGLGRRLMQSVLDFARNEGLRGVTLTTYAHLPFNAGFYRTLGFEEFRGGDDDDADEVMENRIVARFGLDAAQAWAAEQQAIVRPELRVWMVKWL